MPDRLPETLSDVRRTPPPHSEFTALPTPFGRVQAKLLSCQSLTTSPPMETFSYAMPAQLTQSTLSLSCSDLPARGEADDLERRTNTSAGVRLSTSIPRYPNTASRLRDKRVGYAPRISSPLATFPPLTNNEDDDFPGGHPIDLTEQCLRDDSAQYLPSSQEGVHVEEPQTPLMPSPPASPSSPQNKYCFSDTPPPATNGAPCRTSAQMASPRGALINDVSLSITDDRRASFLRASQDSVSNLSFPEDAGFGLANIPASSPPSEGGFDFSSSPSFSSQSSQDLTTTSTIETRTFSQNLPFAIDSTSEERSAWLSDTHLNQEICNDIDEPCLTTFVSTAENHAATLEYVSVAISTDVQGNAAHDQMDVGDDERNVTVEQTATQSLSAQEHKSANGCMTLSKPERDNSARTAHPSLCVNTGSQDASKQSNVMITETDINAREPKGEIRHGFPLPKRPTLASQKLQYEKLAEPFRCPLRAKGSPPSESKGSSQEHRTQRGQEHPVDSQRGQQSHAVDVSQKQTTFRTKRAGKQFKSPMIGSDSVKARSTVRLTPTIQARERTIQTLKRAIKVKEEGEEQHLRELTTKWREAGREVAWEMWSLAERNEVTDSRMKRGYQDSWGWEEPSNEKKRRMDGLGNWDTSSIEENNDDSTAMQAEMESGDSPCPRTLGTMLRDLGVDPEVLGWNDEEGTFVDS